VKRERAVPCPDVVCWVSTARPSDGKTATARWWGRDALPAGLTEDFVCLPFIMFERMTLW